MGLEKVISICAVLAIWAASTGQLPKIIREVHIAQLKLLKESQSKNWGRALLLPKIQSPSAKVVFKKSDRDVRGKSAF